MNLPFISVIIPAYNAERTIDKTIQAIFAQDYQGEKELIIVNDGSKDQTEQRLRAYPLVYLYQDNAGPASARNLGAQNAKGEILVFTDSDCVPHGNWLSELVKGFTQSDIGAVAGSYSIANQEFMLSRIIHDEIRYRHEKLMPDFPQAFGSYNVAILKSVFQQVQGFSTQYRFASGEDNDLSYKILEANYKIRFIPKALVAHFHQNRLWKYLQEQHRHGFWRVQMYLNHPQMAKGDGYTFWKDIIEPFFVGVFFLMLFLSIFWAFIFLMAFLIFEFCFSFLMMRKKADSFIGGFVFLYRAFARTLGFAQGIIYNIKKIKK